MMEHDKPFKTISEQLDLLKKRHLQDVNKKSGFILEEIGYYALINGYKWPFLKCNPSGEVIDPEEYNDSTTFNDILYLYKFDFELRNVLYRVLLKYESMLKASIAYWFSDRYREEHSYLAIDNYSRNPNKTKTVVKLVSELSSTLSKYSGRRENNAIKHYVNKHGHVPLWVLTNFLTFGNMNYFYEVMTDDLRIKVANDFRKMHMREYNLETMDSISPDILSSMNKVVNLFRNTVAHGNITYSEVIEHAARVRSIVRKLNLREEYVPQSQTGVFELIICLKLFVPKEEYEYLCNNVLLLIGKYENKFSSRHIMDVLLNAMHFPLENYKLILSEE